MSVYYIMEDTHHRIKEYYLSEEKIESVSELIELPNKYNDNVSHFTLKHSYKDEFNYTVLDFNINWDSKTLFVRLVGYFNFDSYDDIITEVNKYL